MDDVVRGELAGKGKKKQRACGRVPVRIYDGGGLTQRWPGHEEGSGTGLRPRAPWQHATSAMVVADMGWARGGFRREGRLGMRLGRGSMESGDLAGLRGAAPKGLVANMRWGRNGGQTAFESRCFGKWSTRGLPVSSERIGHSVRLGMYVIRRRSGCLVPQRMRSLGASRGGLTIQSRPCAGSRRRAI